MTPLEERVARVVGARPVAWEARAAPWQPAAGVNERWSVALDDGRRVFVKHTVHPELADWLRREHRVYAHVRGPFLPALVGWDDEGGEPLLVLEDLSDADWPPPWTPERVDAVRRALAQVNATPPPPGLLRVSEYLDVRDRWARVERDPEPFLALGLVPRAWLERALPVLTEAARSARVDGDELVHFDVRSDNLCVRDGQAILFDWSHACLGNGAFELACWLPSLAAEGGPQPHELLAGEPELAAAVAGFFAAVAGLPAPATAPTVRALQLAQLVPALEWARRELGL